MERNVPCLVSTLNETKSTSERFQTSVITDLFLFILLANNVRWNYSISFISDLCLV